MLFNPKWTPRHEADALTLEGFAEWLETQDPNTVYLYIDGNDCAWAKYMKAIKYPQIQWNSIRFPEGVYETVIRHPHTLGEALKRARAILARKASLQVAPV